MIVYPISELALSSVPCPTLSLYNYMIRGGCRLCISFVFSVFGSWHMVQEAIVGNSTKVCHTLKTKRSSESLPVSVESLSTLSSLKHAFGSRMPVPFFIRHR